MSLIPEQPKAPTQQPKPRPWPLGNTIAIAILAGAVVGAVFGFVAGFIASTEPIQRRVFAAMPAGLSMWVMGVDTAGSGADVRSTIVAKNEERATIATVIKSAPGVVSIVADKDAPDEEDEFFREFFGVEPEMLEGDGSDAGKRRVSSGTGFFVSADGYLVTNRHVVADVQADYFVVLADGATYPVAVLARDNVNDIAVLKAEGDAFPYVELGDSDRVKVGQTAIAIGYALGRFGNTVSRGIVSGLGRSIRAEDSGGVSADLLGLIQTDAAINLGNSGGPLLDLDGRAIGMNAAIVGGAQSIGFAIPVNDVKLAVDSVRATGRIQRPFLGVRYLMIDTAMQKRDGLAADHGALIIPGEEQGEVAVAPGSPAEQAGIKEQDIIVKVDGERLDEAFPLAVAIRRHRVGDTVRLTVLRDGEEQALEVTLTERQ